MYRNSRIFCLVVVVVFVASLFSGFGTVFAAEPVNVVFEQVGDKALMVGEEAAFTLSLEFPAEGDLIAASIMVGFDNEKLAFDSFAFSSALDPTAGYDIAYDANQTAGFFSIFFHCPTTGSGGSFAGLGNDDILIGTVTFTIEEEGSFAFEDYTYDGDGSFNPGTEVADGDENTFFVCTFETNSFTSYLLTGVDQGGVSDDPSAYVGVVEVAVEATNTTYTVNIVNAKDTANLGFFVASYDAFGMLIGADFDVQMVAKDAVREFAATIPTGSNVKIYYWDGNMRPFAPENYGL